ncbi:MAG: hypothetical protein YFSK_4100 [Candidatus Yanofskyibacterium parasiticum]|nr:MAG: hypothetical protein YFSK_4100 [Candidatus Yanofskybacteria bacterium]
MEQEYENYQEEGGENKLKLLPGASWVKLALFAVAGILMVAIIALLIFAKTGDGGKAPAEKNQLAGDENVVSENQSEVGSAVPAQEYNYQAPSQESCRGLPSEEEIRLCLDNVIADKAIQGKNLSACYEINSESLRFACVSRVARGVQDADLCLETSDSLAQYRCVAMIASEKNDSALCDKLSSSEDRQNCQDQVAAFSIAQDENRDSLYKCRKLKSQEYIDLCFLHSFINKFNGDCAAVPQNYRQECLNVLVNE